MSHHWERYGYMRIFSIQCLKCLSFVFFLCLCSQVRVIWCVLFLMTLTDISVDLQFLCLSSRYCVILAYDPTNTCKQSDNTWARSPSGLLPRRQQLSLHALVPAQVSRRSPKGHGADRTASLWKAKPWEELWSTFQHNGPFKGPSSACNLQRKPSRQCRVLLCSEVAQCFNSSGSFTKSWWPTASACTCIIQLPRLIMSPVDSLLSASLFNTAEILTSFPPYRSQVLAHCIFIHFTSSLHRSIWSQASPPLPSLCFGLQVKLSFINI